MGNISSAFIVQIFAGFILGAIIGYLAWRAGALSRSGAWAATLTGGLIFGLGGLAWAVALLLFFISSSLLSRLFKRRKIAVSEKFSKGSQRDWGQVLANGGLGAALAVVHAFLPGLAWPWVAFAGAMAAVNADTWATELGVLSPNPPRLITTGEVVERGTSGGVSVLGTFSTLSGAFLIGLGAALFNSPSSSGINFWGLVGVATAGGLVGSLFDSLLGATLQAIYFCASCQKETEHHPLHTCGTETRQVRGLKWLNNDVVNFACSLVGALVAVGTWVLL